MNIDFNFEVKYWSDRLIETSEKAAELSSKTWEIPFVPFTIEETYELRYVLQNYRSYSTLLEKAVKAHLDAESKKNFFQKLFNK